MAQEQDNDPISEDDDLGAQLDALVSDLRQAEPDLVKDVLKTAGEQSKRSRAARSSEAITEAPASTGDAPSAPSPAEPVEPAVAEPPPAVEAADDSATQSQAEVKDEDQTTMDAIDDLLAEQADDAVAGEFETVNDVLAAAEGEAGSTAEASAAEPSADQPAVERRGAGPPPQDEEELDFEGTFDTPDQVIADSGEREGPAVEAAPAQPVEQQEIEAEPVEGSSESVAQELDEQPEAVEVDASASDESAEPKSALEDSAEPAESVESGKKPAVVVLTTSLKRGGYVMNLPIARLSESKRQLVGYVALLTMFNGVMWFGFNLVKSMFAGG